LLPINKSKCFRSHFAANAREISNLGLGNCRPGTRRAAHLSETVPPQAPTQTSLSVGYSFGRAFQGRSALFLSKPDGSYDDFRNMPDYSEPNDLSAHVIRVIAHTQRMPAESISLDSTFEELKIDSLDGINIVFALENEFGINIPDEGVQDMRSVRGAVEGVRKLIDEQKQTVPPGAA
jgi:acyl carrier protein